MMPRWEAEVCCACPVGLVCLILSFRREKVRQPWETDHAEDPVAHLRWCPMCKHNYFSVNAGYHNATDIHEDEDPRYQDLTAKEWTRELEINVSKWCPKATLTTEITCEACCEKGHLPF